MRVGIVGSASGWYVQRLIATAPAGVRAVPIPFSQLAAHVGGGWPHASANPASDFDLLIVRSMPAGSLEQVVFRMDVLHACQDAGVLVINSPRALETAVDKYLALHRLRQEGLLVPETAVCQTVEQAVSAYDRLGPDVLIKPLFGSEGRGIVHVNDRDLVQRTASLLVQLGAVIYMQTLVPHEGRDWRLMVIGQDVLGMERRRPGHWRCNVRQGGQPVPLRVTPELADIALRAARAVGARWAGVDVLPGRDERLYVLEVNAVPGWRGLAEATGVPVAERLWEDARGLVGTVVSGE